MLWRHITRKLDFGLVTMEKHAAWVQVGPYQLSIAPRADQLLGNWRRDTQTGIQEPDAQLGFGQSEMSRLDSLPSKNNPKLVCNVRAREVNTRLPPCTQRQNSGGNVQWCHESHGTRSEDAPSWWMTRPLVAPPRRLLHETSEHRSKREVRHSKCQ